MTAVLVSSTITQKAWRERQAQTPRVAVLSCHTIARVQLHSLWPIPLPLLEMLHLAFA